jgi:hypothetical protein
MSHSDEASPASAAKLPNEAVVYLKHLWGLVPGRKVPVFQVHTAQQGPVDDWTEPELTLAVEEGRRQLDRLFGDVERIRTRAQFLFTTCLGFLVVIFAGRTTMMNAKGNMAMALWSLALTLSGFGLLGSASVIVASKDLRAVDTVLLTSTDRPILPALVESYGRCVQDSTNTVATQLTVFRDAAWLVLVGIVVYGLAWLTAVV